MYLTFVVSVSQRTITNREENHPRESVTTVVGDLRCKDTQLFDICQ